MYSSKQQIIDEHKANLPLPEQPPKASDWNSADERNVNVGSGKIPTQGDALKNQDPSAAGREAKDNLGGLPNDAVAREKKNASGLADTTNADYGYPQKNDPSAGIQK